VLDRDYVRALDLARAGPVEEAFDWQFWFVPRALWIGEILNLQNQAERARPHYALAARMLEERVKAFPSDPRYRSSLGIAYAGLGRRQEAIQTATTAVALLPPEKEAYRGAYAVESLARVHAMTGDRGKAVQFLTDLLATPSPMSAGILRCDPRWDVLRGHHGFEQLLRTQ
jgi:tetratricopeptide (TPR) repeat protein